MPKTILAASQFPDIKKAFLLHLEVDESVLDEFISLIANSWNKDSILRSVMLPQEDFIVESTNIPILRSEIIVYLNRINERNVKNEVLVFLYAFDGICSSCEKIGLNLYGFAD